MATIETLIRDAYASWDEAETLSRAGQELQRRSRFDHARAALHRAVDLRPRDVHAWRNLAYAYMRSLRGEKGEEVLRRGIEVTDSDHLRAVLATFTSDEEEAARLWKAVEGSTEPAVRAQRLAHEFWQAEERGPLLEGLRALVREHPEDRHARDHLLWILLRAKTRGLLGEEDVSEEAGALAELAIRDDPDLISGYWTLQQIRAAHGDWEGVLDAARRGLERLPDEETLMHVLARAHREKGDPDRAAQWLLRAIGAKPSFVGARVDLGRLYEERGRLDLAEEVFREIPRANPDYPVGPVSLALFLGRRGQWEEAEAILREAWPGVPEVYRRALRANPDAEALLSREGVQEVLAT